MLLSTPGRELCGTIQFSTGGTMGDDDSKSEIRVEDRRFFDKDGKPVNKEEIPEKSDARGSASGEAIDFISLLFTYIQTALIHLGDAEDPIEHKVSQNLEGARQMIEILDLMKVKTKGNLNSREEQFLESALFDLRMRYVQKVKGSS